MRKRLYRAGLAWLMAVGVALLLRWLYVVWPNTLTAVLTPVSASPWEWGKALYWPVLAALLLLRWMAADETEHPAGRAWWLAAALPLVMTGACWALGAAGESILWIWLAVLTLGAPGGTSVARARLGAPAADARGAARRGVSALHGAAAARRTVHGSGGCIRARADSVLIGT